MKSTILGCGYVGEALLELWQNTHRQLAATTTTETRCHVLAKLANEVFVVKGTDFDKLQTILATTDQLVVSVSPNRGQSYTECYVETARALSKILPLTPIKQLVVLSSISLYGECGGGWVDESSAVNLLEKNTQALYQAEQVYQHSIPKHIETSILRLGGIFGPGREIEKIAKKLSGTKYGSSGTAYSNWVHRQDIARAVDWALEHHLLGIYNVCCDSHPTKSALYSPILEWLNLPPIQWDPTLTSPHASNKRVSSKKIKDTGFSFSFSPDK